VNPFERLTASRSGGDVHNEKNDLKERIIKAGFWGPNEEGDPRTDVDALELLLERMEKKLAKEVSLLFYTPTTGRPEYEACCVWQGTQYTIASGASLEDAVCKGAVDLPDFLRRHPECAAPVTRNAMHRS